MANEIRELELKAKSINDAGQRLLDGDGLIGTVRVDRKGTVCVGFKWCYRSPATGKAKEIVCGVWPTNTLKDIRVVRDRFRVMVKDGIDPAENKKANKLAAKADQEEAILREKDRLAAVAEAHARMTVGQLFDRWETTELVSRSDKGKEVRRMFEKDVLPHIGTIAAEDLRKGHVMAVIDKLKQRDVPRMTRVIFSLIRQMMRFAVDRDLIESDPTAGIRKEKAVGKDAERDRVLSEDEIKLLAVKLPTSGLSVTAQAAVWIMLGTLCRVGEISKARWANVDLKARKWRIPPEDAKNKKEHVIALSNFAAAQFQVLKDFQVSKEWVLPSRDGKSSLDEKTITKQIRDRQRTEQLKGRAKPDGSLLLPGGDWTSHDLRRSGATLIGDLGVYGEITERCLNHLEQNRLKRIYQRQKSEQAMTEAWVLLGERLEVLTGANGAESTPEPSGEQS